MKRISATLIAPAVAVTLLSPAQAIGGTRAEPLQSPPNCPAPLPREDAPEGIVVTLDVEGGSIRLGEPVKMTIAVRNEGSSPVSYSHGGQEFDFWVRNGDRRVWIWSAGKVFVQYLKEETLQPGEERSASVRWRQKTCKTGADGSGPRQPVPPGRYVARGLWVSGPSDSWWSGRVQFTVTP